MGFTNIIFELAIIFGGASILATIFLFFKQPIILAYIALGVLVGPWGFNFIENAQHIEKISHFGIILLMFLLGLHLQPTKLVGLFKKTATLSIGTSVIFLGVLGGICLLFEFNLMDSLLVGGALMFSSTVIGLKLIPTHALHHKHKGELMTSVLLFQDIIAIILILLVTSNNTGAESNAYIIFPILLIKMAAIALGAFLAVKYILISLFRKFDIIQEYIFIVSLGWSLLMAEIAKISGLSYEMGAFIAGISIASSPVAWIIAEHLKSLREFFLILFFFSIGAQFNYSVTGEIIVPALVLTCVLLILKPISFSIGFQRTGETGAVSKEMGMRLGQASEFSLLVAASALEMGKISINANYLIQLVTILSFIISTYLVVNRYPTPISAPPTKKAA